MTNTPPLVIIGDIITDIIVRRLEAQARDSDTRSKIEIQPGGSAANLAAWLAYTGVPEVNFVGRAGNDPFGLYHRQDLQKLGVTPHLSLDPDLPTGTIVVLVDHQSGERHMLTDRGANARLSSDDIPWKLFRPGSCFHLSGYTLLEENTRQVALKALEVARRETMLISVDPSSASLLKEIGPARFLEWTGRAHLCFPNLDEGRLLTGLSEPQAIASSLAEQYGEVVLKLGPGGALWARQGHSSLHEAALPATVVDTTGAGDAFCAGFLAAWLQNRPTGQAMQAGAQLAARVIAQPGARPPGLQSQ